MKSLCQHLFIMGMVGFGFVVLSGCGGGSSSSTLVLDSSATLSGVAVSAGSDPVAGVTVNAFLVLTQDQLLTSLLLSPLAPGDDEVGGATFNAMSKARLQQAEKAALSAPTLVATTTTNGVGRFSFEALGFGLYDIEFDLSTTGLTGLAPLRFDNRPHLDATILEELQSVALVSTNTIGRFMTVFLPPLVGSVDIVSNMPTSQTLVFDDGQGADPLPGLSLFVPMNLQVVKNGVPLADGASTTLELSLVAPEQVPTPFRDELGAGRTNQLFFSLQPAGVEFVVPGSYDSDAGFGTDMLVQVTYPNVNGLAPGASVALFRFDHENPQVPGNAFRWVGAGTGTVDGTGTLVEPNVGAGLPESGWHGPPGPPPPTVKVQGDLKLPDGSLFAQAGITIVTNNGFKGITDASGHFCILDVPIIGGGTQLICRAFTDVSLTYEVAVSVPQPVSFPTTVCDIVLTLQGSPLDVVSPQVESTAPDHGDGGVVTNAPIVVTFDELMDELTLPGSIAVTVAATGVEAPVAGTVIAQTVAGDRTLVLFVPDAELLPETLYNVTVGPDVADLNGNVLADPYLFSFTTDSGPTAGGWVFAMVPESGPAGTTVTVSGVNLGGVSVTFNGSDVALNPGSSSSAVAFDVPTMLNVSAGDKVVAVNHPFTLGGPVAQGNFALKPSIIAVTPSSRLSGAAVVVTGNNFASDGSNTSVTFNSVPGVLGSGGSGIVGGSSDDAQTINVTVPVGGSSGALVVTTAAGFSSAPAFFTVKAAVDAIAPSLGASVPANDADLVLVGSTIALTFDELIAADSTLTVMQDDGVSAAVELLGEHVVTGDAMGQGVLTFLPVELFVHMSQITVVPDAVSDLSGNLVNAFTVQFTVEDGVLNPSEIELQLDTALENGELQAAKSLLESLRDHVSSTADQKNKAKLLLAFVDYSLTLDAEGTGLGATALHALLSGFGFPAGGPDLFNLDLFTSPAFLPSDSPTCDELQDFAAGFGIPALVALVVALEALPSTLNVPLASSDGLSTVEVDGTDVLAVTTLAKLCLVQMHCALAFGCDLDLDSLLSGSLSTVDVWNASPLLGSLNSPAQLIAAQKYIREVSECYGLTVDSLLAETDEQLDDLTTFGTGLDVALNQAAAEDLRNDLAMIAAATLGAVNRDLGNGDMLSVDLSTPFSTLSLRDLVPVLVTRSAYPFQSVSAGHPLLDLNGIVSPGITAGQGNDLLGLVSLAVDPSATINLTDGSTADWPGNSLVISDPTGVEDLGADLGDAGTFTGRAVDIQSLHVAHDSFDYFFRVDFDGGTPGADETLLANYRFSLESNDTNVNLPYIDGFIQPIPGGTASLALFVEGTPLLIDGFGNPVFAQAGDGFLEWRVPLTVLGAPPAAIPDGARYLVTFTVDALDTMTNEFSFDEVGVAEVSLVLP
ncbi:MAG: hypothetical protein ACI9EF_002154 [Pseudohongiellaceae bacterium]|jgi:hypothetical protein